MQIESYSVQFYVRDERSLASFCQSDFTARYFITWTEFCPPLFRDEWMNPFTTVTLWFWIQQKLIYNCITNVCVHKWIKISQMYAFMCSRKHLNTRHAQSWIAKYFFFTSCFISFHQYLCIHTITHRLQNYTYITIICNIEGFTVFIHYIFSCIYTQFMKVI